MYYGDKPIRIQNARPRPRTRGKKDRFQANNKAEGTTKCNSYKGKPYDQLKHRETSANYNTSPPPPPKKRRSLHAEEDITSLFIARQTQE